MLHHDAVAVMTARILVIEDEPGIRSFVLRALSRAGYAVGEAADGREELTIAVSDPPDVLLLNLPISG